MSPIKHVVVVMLENRSYDNVLGWLYHPDNAPPYHAPPDGQRELAGPGFNPSRRLPPGIQAKNQTTSTCIEGTDLLYAPTAIPLIDPGEPFKDMAQQILGLDSLPHSNPYVGYPPADDDMLTMGYVYNYEQLTKGSLDLEPRVPVGNLPDVMNYLTPAQMPVSAFLANRYAVCDQWFASAPTQTFTNRVFSLCAAPGVKRQLDGRTYSLIDDIQYLNPVDATVPLPTVLRQLDTVLGTSDPSRPNWKLYFHDYSIALATVSDVAAANVEGNVHLATFDGADWLSQCPMQLKSNGATTFVADVQRGWLPALSIIEPRYTDNLALGQLPANSNHPGTASIPELSIGGKHPIDAATGEVLLLQVYNLLRSSPIWEDTVLIVTYDEHGGLYDHVPPPKAVRLGKDIPPVSSLTDKAADGFDFNVLGGRVPAIVVSPRIAPGSMVRSSASNGGEAGAFDHTAIIRTVWDAFDLGPSALTPRDGAAPSLMPFLQGELNPDPTPPAQIVVGPGALNFVKEKGSLGLNFPQTLLATCSPFFPLQARMSAQGGSGLSWLSITIDNDEASMVTRIKVGASAQGLGPGTYQGSIEISGPVGADPVVVPVTLHVRH
ncbi:alkaline phosphatase family protein [Roseateles chitinivorans]|uniref:alkaline phosphatase family protein n=1 Tax=Roseateles chitinivorans TaxID=2917965 RepID=UPI003D67CC7C